MKYRQQLLYYLDKDEDYTAMLDWVKEQPDLDQPHIERIDSHNERTS
jgi:hypothetical protein